ncbi:MAG: fibrobacter succinogenes major paralogous domain-containing protein [Polyangiales bacterium]
MSTWAAAMNGEESSSTNPGRVQGVCPSGWHLPGRAEWKQLEMFLGMSQASADSIGWRGTDEGGKLKEAGFTHWDSPNTGATNSSGFTALPAGYRYEHGEFSNIGFAIGFWTSEEYDTSTAWIRYLDAIRSDTHQNNNDKNFGFSIRCVQD